MPDGRYFSAAVSIRAVGRRLTAGGTDMKYMWLIYDEAQVWAKLSEVERQQIYGEYGQFSQQIKSSGQYVTGAQLQPISAATSGRVRNGKRLLTDGPFAETREQLCGYYLVDAKDLDEALVLTASISSARLDTNEMLPHVTE